MCKNQQASRDAGDEAKDFERCRAVPNVEQNRPGLVEALAGRGNNI